MSSKKKKVNCFIFKTSKDKNYFQCQILFEKGTLKQRGRRANYSAAKLLKFVDDS